MSKNWRLFITHNLAFGAGAILWSVNFPWSWLGIFLTIPLGYLIAPLVQFEEGKNE